MIISDYSYARVEVTHEAVSAAEKTTKMRAFRLLEKKAATTVFVKQKETVSMARVKLKGVHKEASCSSQRENHSYQLLHYLSSLKDEQQVILVWTGSFCNVSNYSNHFQQVTY